MAKPSTKTANKTPQPNSLEDDEDLPEGFADLSGGRVDGWFDMERGNKIIGVVTGSFQVKSNFGADRRKKVYRIKITRGETKAVNSEGVVETHSKGAVIGIDERGWLKGLNEVEIGREVYIKCLGKSEPTEDQPRGVWRFRLAAVPF